jgi:hypothetical protein
LDQYRRAHIVWQMTAKSRKAARCRTTSRHICTYTLSRKRRFNNAEQARPRVALARLFLEWFGHMPRSLATSRVPGMKPLSNSHGLARRVG